MRLLIHKDFHCWEHFPKKTLGRKWQQKAQRLQRVFHDDLKDLKREYQNTDAGAIFFQGFRFFFLNCHDPRVFLKSLSSAHLPNTTLKPHKRSWWAFNISKCLEQKDEVPLYIMLLSPCWVTLIKGVISLSYFCLKLVYVKISTFHLTWWTKSCFKLQTDRFIKR